MIITRLITYPTAYVMWGGMMWYSQIISPFDFTSYLHYIPLCNANFYHLLQTSPYFLIEFFRIIYLYSFTFCIVGGIGYYLIVKRDYLKSDVILIDIALGWLIAGLIYTFFVVQSPFQVGVANDLTHDSLLWIFTKPTYEIPSLHTAYSVLMALHFKDEKSKIKYLFYALGILIPISTLFMGQHWIVDVITGIIFAYILYKLPKNIHLRIHDAINVLSGCYGIKKIK
nr:phosphatase PAP2 family protein [Methanothermococcus okinawensis]